MSNKFSKIVSGLTFSGMAVCAAYTVAGNIFVENMLGRNGIKNLIAQGGLLPSEDTDCFYHSEEALKGIEFYRKHIYKDAFTFDKYSKCLRALYYENEGSHLYAISCHGFTGDPSQNNIYARRFYEMGYNVLLPYLRGHGKSEHYYCTMGWYDRFDIVNWINYIVDMDPDAKIVLHGASMGAATVMNVTGEKLPENVICCIEDCGFTSLRELYIHQLKGMTKFPPELLLNLFNPAVKKRAGFDINENNPVIQVRKSKTPTLFIHGEKDTTVPPAMVYPLYKNADCEKEMLIVEGATHCAAGYVYPEIYWNAITKFIEKYAGEKK